MKLYLELLKAGWRKYVLRQPTGTVIRKFSTSMGLVYIKFAQILATQKFGRIFTEADRKLLSGVCDDLPPVSFRQIEQSLNAEYGHDWRRFFRKIEDHPVGSASISQVHRAWLKNGAMVAVKVKRRDVAQKVEHDLHQLRRLVHLFGRWAGFCNFEGGDVALEMLLTWIQQEVDFTHEAKNIQAYQNFADTVNGQVEDCVRIVLPKLYAELCTPNILVMEFIEAQTLNQLELTQENRQKAIKGLNSYIKLSFWALLHDQSVIFHGDPHGGNIYFDEQGNIGFLDMGLMFNLGTEDCALTRQFFLTAYSRKSDKLYATLAGYGKLNESEQQKFLQDCQTYCNQIQQKNVTYYFTDMINICLKYEFVPPRFLFCMAKAFICLNGITVFTDNQICATELLQAQIAEYLVRRSFHDCRQLAQDGASCLTAVDLKSWDNLSDWDNLAQCVTSAAMKSSKFTTDLATAKEHFLEALDLIMATP